MAYTLISCVGTGMFVNKTTNEKEYRETTYLFPDGSKKRTKVFLEALLSCSNKSFDKIILVGTRTSNWGALICEKDFDDENVFALYEKLYSSDKTENGIQEENVAGLEEYLTKRFSVPVKLFISSALINEDTALDLFSLYSSIVPEISPESNILFDITHSFRSIPILVYQALQFSLDGNSSGRTVELVYGEYIDSDKVSYVRNLSKYWSFTQFSNALNLFATKLDGFKLAALIADEWPKGSKAIKRISEITQLNFSIQIIDVLHQIKNALKEFPAQENSLLLKTKSELEKLYAVYDEESLSKTFYNYSKFLHERNLNVQAVITLQVAVEACIIEKFANIDEQLGDYDWWQDYGKDNLKALKGDNWKEIGEPLRSLENFRNQAAHGGAKDKKTKQYPSASNVDTIYCKGLKGVEKLFEAIKEL